MAGKHDVWSRPGLKRLNYFYGRVLTADDLQREQDYFVNKLRQLNRAALGVGIVTGLKVSSKGGQVTVSPGVGVDSSGRLIELPEACRFELPVGGRAWNVFIGITDVESDPQPIVGAADDPSVAAGFGSVQEVTRVWIEEAADLHDQEELAGVWLGLIRARKPRPAGRSVRQTKARRKR